MSNLFKVKLHCVVFGVDVPLNKRCVLSLDKNDIIFPYTEISKDNLLNSIDSFLMEFLKQYIFISDLELIPQFINFYNTQLNKEDNDESDTLNIAYGFIVSYSDNINNCFWVDFDPLKEHHYSNILFEVMQKLR